MQHRSIARAASAVILGAGVMLGTAAPALAQDTGPESQACQTAETNAETKGSQAQQAREERR